MGARLCRWSLGLVRLSAQARSPGTILDHSASFAIGSASRPGERPLPDRERVFGMLSRARLLAGRGLRPALSTRNVLIGAVDLAKPTGDGRIASPT